MPEYVEGSSCEASETGLAIERARTASGGRTTSRRRSAPMTCGPFSASVGQRPALRRSSPSARRSRGQSQHLDSELMSPGHPLFAAVDEVLNQKIAGVARVGALRRSVLAAPLSPSLLRRRGRGRHSDGSYEPATGALVTVVEDASGRSSWAHPTSSTT